MAVGKMQNAVWVGSFWPLTAVGRMAAWPLMTSQTSMMQMQFYIVRCRRWTGSVTKGPRPLWPLYGVLFHVNIIHCPPVASDTAHKANSSFAQSVCVCFFPIILVLGNFWDLHPPYSRFLEQYEKNFKGQYLKKKTFSTMCRHPSVL